MERGAGITELTEIRRIHVESSAKTLGSLDEAHTPVMTRAPETESKEREADSAAVPAVRRSDQTRLLWLPWRLLSEPKEGLIGVAHPHLHQSQPPLPAQEVDTANMV